MPTSINEITFAEIKRLTPFQLSQLLLTLLETESKEKSFEIEKLSVPFNITTADGGEDGLLIKSDKSPKSRWITFNYSFFQNKATDLSLGECKEEVLEKKKKGKKGKLIPRKLKPRVQTLIENKGVYILFTTAAYVELQKAERIEKIREGLELGGYKDFATFPVVIYDANSIAQWVNAYIGAVSLVQTFCNIHRPNGFLTWDGWAKMKNVNKGTYQTDSILSSHEKGIDSSISSVRIIRIMGHSGLGKTRLVFEAFRNSTQKGNIVYYDHQGSNDIKSIKDYFLNHQENQVGIIVIDNCTAKNHITIEDILTVTGRLNVITIGYDDDNSIEGPKIKLDRKNQFQIVENIINDRLKDSHSLEDKIYLKELCEGYPWMADRFCTNILSTGLSNFSTTLPDIFIMKLLFGGEKNIQEYEIIRACSVFSSFGFPDDSIREILSAEKIEYLKAQVEYIRLNIYDGSVTYDKFYETCQKYRSEDIIERQGLYYVVKPTILAINLAADWLVKSDNAKLKKILIELMGHELGNKITERLTDLDQITKASDIVQTLWGPSGFFASAEVLNTSWGSLLFRNVVEVNSIATARGIQESLGGLSSEKLKLIKEGRRNLVWALEKLAFKKETFNIAARLLLSFGVAENETWSNNASNQFSQLFQVYLAGTQADYSERILILEWGLRKNDIEYTKLCIQAIGRAFNIHNTFRMGGPEKQGSGPPLKEFTPSSNEQIENYWKSLLNLLAPYADKVDEVGKLARSQISSAIRQFVSVGQVKLITTTVLEISGKISFFWKEAYDNFAKTLEYERPKEENLKAIQDLMEVLKPTDLNSRFLLNVINPSWNSFETDSRGIFIDKAKQNSIDFADYVYRNEIDIVPHLQNLLVGEQKQTFVFAQRLGELLTDISSLLETSILIFKNIDPDKRSPEFIGGLIAGAKNDEYFNKAIDLFIHDKDLNKYAFYLTRNYTISIESLLKLFTPVEEFNIPVSSFNTFQYGRILEGLTIDELIILTDKIKIFGLEGKWTALCLLYMNSFSDAERWSVIKEEILKLIGEGNMLLHNSDIGVMEVHYWETSITSLLQDSERNDFAETISKQIIEFCSQERNNYSVESQLLKVVEVLFEKYFDIVWDIFGSCLIGSYPGYFNLKNLLWVRELSRNPKSEWIFENEERSNFILNWVKNKGHESAKRIAGLMPLGIKKENRIVWHPFAKELLELFGNHPEVLSEVSANMGTFGTIGSTVEYYNVQKDLLEQLLDSRRLEVRDWALKMIQFTDRNIKKSQLEDEGGQHI